MLSASYFVSSDPGQALGPRNSFSLSSLNRMAPSWSLITIFTVSASIMHVFRIQGLTIWHVESNSTYFQDVDIARTHLICTLFSAGIEQARKSKGQGILGAALGAVSCSFRKEINPFERYEMWTRVLSWDRKWVCLSSQKYPIGQKCWLGSFQMDIHGHAFCA